MGNYLLEVRTEEIPARFMKNTLKDLTQKVTTALDEKNMSYEKVFMTGTPRRLVLFIKGLAEVGKEQHIENRGPNAAAAYKDGEPTKALIGFSKGQGIDPSEVEVRDVGGVSYIFAVKTEPGVKSRAVLPELLEGILGSLSFPKMMRWGTGEYSFVRPVQSMISLYDDEVLPIEFCGITSSNWTVGHRFLSEGKIVVKDAVDYLDALEKAYVICDDGKRRGLILAGIHQVEKELGEAVPMIDDDLLDTVLNLVEYPTVFLGRIKEEYLRLPAEVIILTMMTHQKYFPVKDNKGNLLPYFIGVRCGNREHIDQVIKGNEEVLTARLEDAKFFYDEDLQTPLLEMGEALNKVVFQEQLGTIGDKVERLVALSAYLGDELKLEEEEKGRIDLISRLCKCDLESQMVYELPELEGVMGCYYAKEQGYSAEIAEGIVEHYLPRYAGDAVATSQEGICVSIGDKMDTITGIFGVGMLPTGSQDPFALRRMGLGIVRTLVENKISLSLRDLILKSQEIYGDKIKGELEPLMDFFKVRMKGVMDHLSTEMVESVLEGDFDSPYDTYLKGEALKEFSQKAAFKDLIEILKRSKNITKDVAVTTFKEELFQEKEERILGLTYNQVLGSYTKALEEKDYLSAMESLLLFKGPLEEFFSDVMVMVEDEAVKNNRLGLLGAIVELGDQLFNVSFLGGSV